MASEAQDEEEVVADADDAADKDGIVPLSLEEIKACNIMEMAKDKFRSRQLQRSLRGGPEFSELIFSRVEPHIMELVKDQHGNYLLQKVLEVITPEQFDQVFKLLKDDLVTLAKEAHGTRAVQKIVEMSIARDRVDELLQALPAEQSEDLARNVTGFHVIVKLLESLPADKASDLLELLCGEPHKVLALGKDQWGCCVLKKCLDRAEGPMREKLVDAIREHALELVQDAFGNYVVQHFIINRPVDKAVSSGKLAPATVVIDALKGKMFELSLQKFSSNVLEKCLQNSSDKDRNKIVNEILNPPNQRSSEAVRKLLFHQFGNYVFQQALEVAKEPQFSLLIEHSKQHIQGIIRQTSMEAAGNGAPGGHLPAEHTQRLAVKLVKKYPPLSEGLDMGMDANWMQYGYDPTMAFGYGFDAYGYPFPGMDPSIYDASGFGFGFDSYGGGFGDFVPPVWPVQSQAQAKGAGGNRTRNQGNKSGHKSDSKDRGQKGKQGGRQHGGNSSAGKGADQAGSSKSPETVRVGRIVGFWPNYSIEYDEVPSTWKTPKAAGSRAKKKAAPAPKA